MKEEIIFNNVNVTSNIVQWDGKVDENITAFIKIHKIELLAMK